MSTDAEEQLPLLDIGVRGPDTLLEGSVWDDQEQVHIPWLRLSVLRQRAVVEALIYASDKPLSMIQMRELLGASRKDIMPIVRALRAEYLKPEHGLHLVQVAGGYAFRTKPELSGWLRPLLMARPPRVSRAALETLAIIAYRQPVTRGEVEEVRGVDCGGVVRSLLDKRLIRILGRRSDVGRPMIYGTSREFLETFGLKDLSALPPLAEIRELVKEPAAAKDALEGKAAEDSPESVTMIPLDEKPGADALVRAIQDSMAAEAAEAESKASDDGEGPGEASQGGTDGQAVVSEGDPGTSADGGDKATTLDTDESGNEMKGLAAQENELGRQPGAKPQETAQVESSDEPPAE